MCAYTSLCYWIYSSQSPASVRVVNHPSTHCSQRKSLSTQFASNSTEQTEQSRDCFFASNKIKPSGGGQEEQGPPGVRPINTYALRGAQDINLDWNLFVILSTVRDRGRPCLSLISFHWMNSSFRPSINSSIDYYTFSCYIAFQGLCNVHPR
jgi:hypothetical protein